MANLVETTLYSHEGANNTPLAPATKATQVSINNVEGAVSNVETEIVALRTKLNQAIDAGVHFRGAVNSTTPLPTVAYKAGWQYIVGEAGTYAGNVCEAGDYIICVKDYASGSASNSDWTVLQKNLDGAVTGPSTSVANHVAVFDVLCCA